jgi:hypothetical protein
MSIIFSRILRFAAQKALLNPQVRSAAAKAAKEAAGEVKTIAREKDKARAAGRSVRRVLGRLQGQRDSS